jgi:cytochrome P450/NADPH-cytochrome P450 reductase
VRGRIAAAGDDQAWLDRLIAEDRYVEDVWAG